MCLGTLLVFFFAEPLMRFFTADPTVIAIGRGYLRIVAFVLHSYVILYIISFALQGLQRPRFALLLGIFRQFLAPVPVFWLLAVALRWGVTGVWWGIFFVTWLAACLSLLYIRKTIRELLAEKVLLEE
jgi:Na+-driven multidrug efflux pump